MRASSRLACSSGLTSSQYLSKMIPETTMAFSTGRGNGQKAFGLIFGAKSP
jgi:hypothetical protein